MPLGPSENGALTQYRNIPLWDAGKVPLAKGDGPLDAPFLTAFLPPEGKRNGGSVVIAPGGANIMLMYGAEGLEIAERYNDWGVTAFVLTYRLSPRYGEDARVLDGMRAIQVIRRNAAAWKLDPAKIGFIGFSAGSNMGRTVVAAARAGDPEAADPTRARELADPTTSRSSTALAGATPGESLKSFPPTFLVSAAGDQGPSLGNAQLFMDLTRAGASPKYTSTRKAVTASEAASAALSSATGCSGSSDSCESAASFAASRHGTTRLPRCGSRDSLRRLRGQRPARQGRERRAR